MEQLAEIKVEYGIEDKYIDITDIAILACIVDNVLQIPASDHDRASIFTDPLQGTLKHIRVTKNGQSTLYTNEQSISIDVSDIDRSKITIRPSTWYDPTISDPGTRLELIHRNIRFIGGNMRDEYPEQLMAVMFVPKDAKVLELGSNIGRNTLTIATILSDQSNLVTLECDPNTVITLRKNMDINRYKFHIEDSALSYRKLIQRGWDTIPSEEVLPGYVPVKSITYQELEAKYDIVFDTIVADCEGALYYILSDYPDMLNNIRTIIMENDYHNINHKITVDNVIKSKGFSRIYVRGGGWGPCFGNFFEVWQKQ